MSNPNRKTLLRALCLTASPTPRGLCRASGAKAEGLLHPLYRRFPQKFPFL